MNDDSSQDLVHSRSDVSWVSQNRFVYAQSHSSLLRDRNNFSGRGWLFEKWLRGRLMMLAYNYSDFVHSNIKPATNYNLVDRVRNPS